jgi:uncharacterized phiE125 gp8 family phage protein
MHDTNQTGPTIITGAATYPVTIDEAKAYCLIDGSNDDARLADSIAAATEYVQYRTGQQLISATLLQTWDYFDGCELTLDRWPVSAVSFVKYYDVNGTLTTISSANYWASLRSRPPRIRPIDSYSWPDTQCGRPEAVQVQYVVGYASASVIPASLKTAIKAMVKHLYDSPAPVVATGAIPKEMPKHLEDLILMHDKNGYT